MVEEVVNNYLDCGDLTKGFARIYCEDCKKSMLLPFSCKGRWFCPSCHEKSTTPAAKRVGESPALRGIHHRHNRFPGAAPPLRIQPAEDAEGVLPEQPPASEVLASRPRSVSGKLCRIANECLLEFLRRSFNRPTGQLGMVMTIHTFGEYMGYNCHIHALVADGLFTDNGMFYVAPRVSTTPLEQLFRVRVIQMLVEEELLAPELARKLLGWKHSGFSKIRLWRKRT